MKSLYIDVEWTIVKKENMFDANRRSKSYYEKDYH